MHYCICLSSTSRSPQSWFVCDTLTCTDIPMNQFGSQPVWASVSGNLFFLEVGVCAACLCLSLCYFYVVVRGGFTGELVKPSSGLRLQCEQKGGWLTLIPWWYFCRNFLFAWKEYMEKCFGESEPKRIYSVFLLTHWITEIFLFQTSCCFAGWTSCLGLVEQGGNKLWLTSPVSLPSNRSPAER